MKHHTGIKTALTTIGSATKRKERSVAEEKAFIAHRRVRLVRYMQQLLSLPRLSTSLSLVTWLGAVSAAQNEGSLPYTCRVPRVVEHPER